jgi:hypothetical protein
LKGNRIVNIFSRKEEKMKRRELKDGVEPKKIGTRSQRGKKEV